MNNDPSPNLFASRWRFLTLFFLVLAGACLLAIGLIRSRDAYLLRGLPAGLPEPIRDGSPRIGINIYLNGLSSEDAASTLAQISETGIRYVKQPFYYGEDYDWAATDQLIDAITAEQLTLVPLLDGDPMANFAPPEDVNAFAGWAGEFAKRYGNSISNYIIWDEPNLTSHWGGEPVNPNEYAALLSAAARTIRAADSDAVIIAGPLAPTTETGPDNMAEPLFLAALYEAGAKNVFDIASVKPYGFDNGPHDREVTLNHLNFSRPILVREVMEANGDSHKAVWAGNWGWNSLPDGWTGKPSIWGQTDELQQADWTVAALERACREWPWMGVLFLENWEPGTMKEDPRWGFSIAGRATAAALTNFLSAQPDDLAMPGFHLASPDAMSQQFSGKWEFSPEFGADIGQSGDRVRFAFWGTDVGVRVRRADFRARLYATVDGQPANALPRDKNGAALVLTSPDPAEDYMVTVPVARNLPPGPHVLELVASRGWDQWALNGFSVGYRPPRVSQPWQSVALGILAGLFFLGAIFAARRSEWGRIGARAAETFSHLSDRGQMLFAAGAAGMVALTGWLTWGESTLGIYRRMGDVAQIAATAAAATVFYVSPSFIIFTLALVVLFFLLVLRPAWGVALIALTMPFYVRALTKPIFDYRFSPVEVFTLLTSAAWLVRWLLDAGRESRKGTFQFRRPRLVRADWAVAAVALVATLSLLFTERTGVAVSEWRVVIVEPILFYVLLRAVRLSGREMWVVLDAFVVSGLIIAGYGLWQYATGQNLITAEGGLLRLRSFYGSPNNVALYLDRLLPILVAMWFLGTSSLHGRRKLLYTMAILPVGLAILLTFSKGALFLGVPASMLVVFWVWQREGGRRTWPWVAGGLAAGLTALAVASRIPALAARLDMFGETGVFRINLWRAAVNMIADHPLFGVGLDNFLYAYRGRYILDAAWQEPNLNHPHNIILDFGTRLGLIGLLAGVWLIWETGRVLFRALPRVSDTWLPVAAGLGGSLAAILMHGMVDHSFFLIDLAFVFFLVLGMAIWLEESGQDASLTQSESVPQDMKRPAARPVVPE